MPGCRRWSASVAMWPAPMPGSRNRCQRPARSRCSGSRPAFATSHTPAGWRFPERKCFGKCRKPDSSRSRSCPRRWCRRGTRQRRAWCCYSGRCSHELWSGACGKKRWEVCPETAEDEEDLERMEREARDDRDAYLENLYDARKNGDYDGRW